MRKTLITALILLSFSCKKENASEDITKFNWVLKAQVVTPAITINGKTSTNYLSLQNPEGCSKNFTYSFLESGVFAVGSNGALCDMVANSNTQKWNREGDQIKLIYNDVVSPSSPLKVSKNTITQISILKYNGADYSLTSTYIAKKK